MMIGTCDSARRIRHTSTPGQLGEHQVEQDEVRGVGAEPDQRLAAVARGDGPIALELERVDEGLTERRLVVHDEDRAGHLPRSVIGPG